MKNVECRIRKWAVILSVMFLISFSSCKEDSVIAPYSASYNYAPSDTGRWIIYDVDSTVYDNFSNPSVITNYTYQVIERIASTYIDNEGRTTQLLQRAKRDSAAAPWQNYLFMWTCNHSGLSYEKTEENIRYVKLGFPISFSNIWNGNAYNALGRREYYYESIHETKQVGLISFDSTLTVFQGEPANVVEEKNGLEIFAAHVGLVYKKYNEMEFDSLPNHQNGITYTYTINSHGLHNAPLLIER